MIENNVILKILKINKKSRIFSYLIIFISLFALIMLLVFQNGVSNMINKEIYNKYQNRDLLVTLKKEADEEYIEQLLQNKNIKYVFKNYNSLNLASDSYGILSLNGVPLDYFDKIVVDEEYLNNNYIIMPNSIINEDAIGSKIKLNYNNEKIEFIIAGVYYLDKNEMTNKVYTSTNNYTNIVEEKQSAEWSRDIHVVLENRSKLDETVSILRKNSDQINFYNPTGEMEINLYSSLNKLAKFIILGISSFLLFAFILTISIMINQEKESISILKAVGFSNRKVYLKLLYMLLISIIILYSLSYILSYIIVFLVKKIIKYNLVNFIRISTSNILSGLIIIILLLSVSIFINYFKLRRVSIIQLMNDK